MADRKKLIALRDVTVGGKSYTKGQMFELDDENSARQLINSGQAEEQAAGAGQGGGQQQK